jgi:succinate dehydrogenase hydrophobic anchor subunit
MPLSDVHRRKRAKNYLALALLVAFVGCLFYLTVLKVSGA